MKTAAVAVGAILMLAAGGYGMYRHAEQQKWQAELKDHAREMFLLRSEIDVDRLAVRNAELDQQIAEAHGKRANPTELLKAKSKLEAAEFELKVNEDMDELRSTDR